MSRSGETEMTSPRVRKISSFGEGGSSSGSMLYSVFRTDSGPKEKVQRPTALADGLMNRSLNDDGEAKTKKLTFKQESSIIKRLSSAETRRLRHYSHKRSVRRSIIHTFRPGNKGWSKSKDLYMHPVSLEFHNKEAEGQYQKCIYEAHRLIMRVSVGALSFWTGSWFVADLATYLGSRADDSSSPLATRFALRGILLSYGIAGFIGYKKLGCRATFYNAILLMFTAAYIICFDSLYLGGVPPWIDSSSSKRLSYRLLVPIQLAALCYSSFAFFKLSYRFAQLYIICVFLMYTLVETLADSGIIQVAPFVAFAALSAMLSLGARQNDISSRYQFRYGVHDQFQRGVIDALKKRDPKLEKIDPNMKSNLQFIDWNPAKKLQEMMSENIQNKTVTSFLANAMGGGKFFDRGESDLSDESSKRSVPPTLRRLASTRSRSIMAPRGSSGSINSFNPRRSDMTHHRARSTSETSKEPFSRKKSHSALYKIPFFLDGDYAGKLVEQMKDWDYGEGGIFQRIRSGSGNFKKHPLSVTTFLALTDFGLLDDLEIPTTQMKRALMMVESNYKKPVDVSYHNALHACDVVQSAYFMLTHMEEARESLDAISLFSILFGGCIHDLAHPGTNNSFQVNTNSDLAITYNDRSVLENMHVSTAFRLFADKPVLDFTTNFDLKTFKRYRELVVEVVIGTDLTLHFENKQRFESSLPLDRGEPRHMSMLCATIVHAADIGSVIKEWTIYRTWIGMLFKEFYKQGDIEKKMGLEVAPFMNRDVSSPPQAQKGFINYFVQPLYEMAIGQYCESIYKEVFAPRFEENMKCLERWDESGGALEVPEVAKRKESVASVSSSSDAVVVEVFTTKNSDERDDE